MRVAHVLATAARIGGAEAHVLALAAEQAARGDEVAVLHTLAADANGGTDGSVATRAFSGAALASFRPDVVHVHGEPLPARELALLQRERPAVRSLHDYAFACATGERWLRDGRACDRAHGPGCAGGVALRGCAHRLDLRHAAAGYARVRRSLPVVRAAVRTVVYSEHARSVALRNGLAPERCVAIPYFVSGADAPVDEPSGRDVAFLGRVVRRKGLDVLLRALALVPDAWDELRLAGDGWDADRCRRLATRLGLAGRVRFLGWTGREGIAEVLEASAVVAVPSRWPEPFGIVGLEAMAAGRPVVGSRTGGIPEWLDDGETGLLVPPGDPSALAAALASLLDDPARAAAFGREARRRAARFSPAAHLARLDAVYAEAQA